MVQALWWLVFPVSRASALWLNIGMALLGMAIFHLVARRIRPGWPAVFAGVLLLWTRVVQESNAMKISSVARSSQSRAGKWPSYKYCVDRAPKARGGDKPDISRADFTWCKIGRAHV